MAVLTIAETENKLNHLKEHHYVEHRRMDLVEAWVTLNRIKLEPYIWEGIPKEQRGKRTIVKTTVTATNSSTVALFATTRPSLTVMMKDRTSLTEAMKANAGERFLGGLLRFYNRNRQTSLEHEAAYQALTRGALIFKHPTLTPDERGEVSQEIVDPFGFGVDEFRIGADGQTEVISQQDEGRFPIPLEVLEARECYYRMGYNSRHGPYLFIQEFYAEWDDIVEMYPQILDMQEFSDIHASLQTTRGFVRVIDYWDKEHHSISVDGKWLLKPEEHGYDRLPFTIRRFAEEKLQMSEVKTNDGQVATAGPSFTRAVTPFVWHMIDNAAQQAFGESIVASYLPELASTPWVHTGIREDGSSPWYRRRRRRDAPDGPLTRNKKYSLKVSGHVGGHSVIPAFNEENITPIRPTPIADHVQVYMAGRREDQELVGYASAQLSGQLKSDLTGYAVNQMIQLSIARHEIYKLDYNGAWSDVLLNIAEQAARDWDRGNIPIRIYDIIEEDPIVIDRDMLLNIADVSYQLNEIVPVNREQDITMILQAAAMPEPKASARTVIEALQTVTKVADVDEELARINFERVAAQVPEISIQLALKYARDNGLLGEQEQAAQQPPPAQPPIAPVDPGAAGGLPTQEPVPGQPIPPDGNGSGAGIPPALITAITQSLQGGGV